MWLGEELRGARLAAGYTSQDQFARELGFDRTVIVKAETGARPPSEDLAGKIAEMFSGLCNGLYVQLATIARKSNGPISQTMFPWTFLFIRQVQGSQVPPGSDDRVVGMSREERE